jgi:cyanophycin synthetase
MTELIQYKNYRVDSGPISVEDIKALYGANYFSGGPVVRFRINLGKYDEVFTNDIPGFFERLSQAVPTLYSHHCSVGKAGGLFERIKEGTLLGHVMEHVAIELQNLAGMDVGFGKTRSAKKEGVYNVVFRYFDEIAGVYAGKAALNLINAVVGQQDFDVKKVVEDLIVIREKRLLGPSTQAIVDEAERRKIAVIRLDKYNQVQLGTGKYKKVIRATVTGDTSLLAVETTDDKYLTNTILDEAGIPVPQQIITEELDHALEFHTKLGRPIVIKPAKGYQGNGVSIDLNTPDSIEKAFLWAKAFHNEIIVQDDIPGGTYRFLVINFRMIAAVRLIPPYITGNGSSSIAEMIGQLNLDPEREFGDKGKLSKVDTDEETLKILALKGYGLQSVLPAGEVVFLKNSGNMRLGSTATDVTDLVHPYNKFLACRIAGILNLNVAGIDILSEDISVPLNVNQGKVIEVNAAPDFRMHFNPTYGTKRYVQREFVSMLFPPLAQSNIPIYAVTGSKGKSLCVAIISAGLRQTGRTTGVVSKNGLFINDFCLLNDDATDSKNVNIVLKDPTVDCAIIETPVEAILASGLGFAYSQFGIFLNIIDLKDEYYTYDHIRDAEDITYAKMVVPEQVVDEGFAIVNADEPMIMQNRPRIYANLALFSKNKENPLFQKHLSKQGTGALITNRQIIIYDKGLEMAVTDADAIRFVQQPDDYALDAIMAGILALYLSDISLDQIRKILINGAEGDTFSRSPTTLIRS